MPAYIDDGAQRLNDLLDLQEARIANIFRTVVAQLRDDLDLNALADLIERGQIEEALAQLNLVAESLGSASNVSFVTAGQSAADFLSTAGVGRIVFDQVNAGAVAVMQQTRLELVREFTAEQRRATQSAILSGVESGTNPRAVARQFRESIGLTERQWQHVANYRSALNAIGTDEKSLTDVLGRELRDRRGDAQVLRAVRENRPLPAEKIDWLVERYQQRYIKYRSEVIGRTEGLRAVNAGNEEMYRQAIAEGTIRPENLSRKWQTRLDGRERETHMLLHDQERAWGEPWTTIHGDIRFPGDPEAPASETIQCFTGDASIFAGGLKRVIVRHYCGKFVELNVGGSVDLAVTPNHPILTQRGWVAAGDVVEGDQLIKALFADRMASPHPDIRDGHASAENLARLTKLAGNVERPRAEIVNLHGEVPDHQVEIISPPSELRDALKSLGAEAFGDLGLESTDIAAGFLLFASMAGQDFGALDAIDRGGVRACDQVSSFLGRHSSESNSIGLAATPDRQTQFLETIDHDVAIQPSLSRDSKDRHFLTMQPSDDWVKGSALFRPVVVTGTRSSWHDGPVYNFETDTGLISSNGYIFHNCRCVIATRIRKP